ncbi:MAG: tRNA 2-thiouridine(34) synthase MnmA [Victivallaceae bacterium]|nr:tRNA 2-thiouridine(34) synthase MnmA [Victivallaceae bacterium]
MTQKKLVAAMSGGVDSSVAAAVSQRQGYEVIGVTLRLKHPNPAFACFQTCLTESDEAAIAGVVEKLKIKHYYLDLYGDFEQLVLRPAWEEYRRGRTPNPCTWCNLFIKFGKLLEFAEKLGAEGLVTGHYVRMVEDNGIYKLRRGVDALKDQSYFLYRLSQRQLARLRFPIGDLEKTAVRALARRLGLKNFGKKDSQDACFGVAGEVFPETLRRLFGGEARPGDFICENKVVGRHAGIHQYTIGQRKGLGVALGKPGYVRSIDSASGRITLVTGNDALESRYFSVDEVSWQNGTAPKLPHHCQVQVRYRSAPGGALVEARGNGLKVSLDVPVRAVTPGQAAVFFDDEFLLGGGIIGKVCKSQNTI